MENQASNRDSQLNVFIGFNGTGKSTLIQKNIDVEVNVRDGRALIVTPDPFEWKQYPEIDLRDPDCFSKISEPTKLVYAPGDLNKIADQYKGFFNGLLIFDDCRCYMKANVQEALRTLVIRRRQRSHDIIAAGHGFTEIPPVFFTYSNRYALFYTQDNVDRRKEEIGSSFLFVKKAVEDVNKMYSKNPHYCKIIKARNNG